MISVICPFYNEAAIIEASIRRMHANLATLDQPWELIVVNDGSTDNSFALAKALEAGHANLRVIGYANNRGRGYALRTGIEAARGEIVVTTEIDCSWGDDIAHRIAKIFHAYPTTDMVIASPNLPGGGYTNVPRRRVIISRVGNMLLRVALNARITMYTGMTRGYRRERFLQLLPIDQEEKEFHLEVARKALAFGFVIRELPATLAWQHDKLAKPGTAERKSSSRVRKLMRSHLLFSAFAAPIRYILLIAIILLLPAIGFFAAAVYNLFTPEPSAFYLLTSFFLFLFALLVLLIGLLTHQNIATQTELWRLRSELRQLVGREDIERR